jgi:signal transduction histidine kinase
MPASAGDNGSVGPRVTPTDLAELMRAFNEVTARLEASHVALGQEVSRLNAQLRDANEQIERSRRLAALGEMAAGIAHEVRNPLGGIRLYARMLEEDLGDRPQQRETATKILSATRAVEEVVRDVLTFAKELRVKRERAGTMGLFEKALAHCRHDGVAGWKGVEVSCEVARGEAAEIECDAPLLCQALTNLVRNAFEAMAETPMPAGGHRLLLRAARARRVRGQPGATVLRVIDTGPGVTKEIAHRMFNPFFTTRSSGTGLGLAIVHRIVEAHGGRVSVRNREDAMGAVVEVHVPDACEAGVVAGFQASLESGPAAQGEPRGPTEKAASVEVVGVARSPVQARSTGSRTTGSRTEDAA